MELTSESFGMSPAAQLIYRVKMAAAALKRAVILPFKKEENERTLLNERAENFMKQYGNQVLRMAYAYVHNMERLTFCVLLQI